MALGQVTNLSKLQRPSQIGIMMTNWDNDDNLFRKTVASIQDKAHRVSGTMPSTQEEKVLNNCLLSSLLRLPMNGS